MQQLRLDFGKPHTVPTIEPGLDVALDHAFPVEEANALAAHESFNKHLFRPNTYLHKWWARRSGTTFRHILKQLVDDPALRDYYAPGGLEGMIVLDPMMGGGTTLHEAIRLGASVIGCDIDPIPVLQARASLSRIPLAEKECVFAAFLSELTSRLAPLFRTTCPTCAETCETQFTFYGVRKKCACGEAILVDSFVLREEADGSLVELSPLTGTPFVGAPPVDSSEPQRRFYEKSKRRCPDCGKPFEELTSEPFYARYVPLVVVGTCQAHGQFLKAPDESDLQLLELATAARQRLVLPGRLEVLRGPKSGDLLSRGIFDYTDLFSARQLIYLSAVKELIDTVDEEHRIWLSLLVSTSLEFNSLLCGYKGSDKRRPGAIRHVFSHHAYSFPYTALENNPVFSGNTSGTLRRLFRDRIQAAAEWAEAPVERVQHNGTWEKVVIDGEMDGGTAVESVADLRTTQQGFLVLQQDSSRLPLPDDCVDHVVTDPPYFDSVQYSDLAHFFRVWLQWFVPKAAEWEYNVKDSAVAETEQAGAKYQAVLGAIWSECHRVLEKPHGRMVFTFHHWRPEAWARLTLALKHARFELVTSYTVQSENPISVHIRQLNALKHDSVLVLKPYEASTDLSKWELMDRIATTDSYTFCSDCARLLGYCLQADLTDEEVIQVWRKALGSQQ